MHTRTLFHFSSVPAAVCHHAHPGSEYPLPEDTDPPQTNQTGLVKVEQAELFLHC